MALRVDVVLTNQDFRDFCKAMCKRANRLPPQGSPSAPLELGILSLVFMTVVVIDLFALGLVGGPPERKLLFMLATSATAIGLVYAFSWRARRRMQPEAMGSVLGPKSYELTEDGILEKTPDAESMFRWRGVKSVEESSDHVFVFTDRCAAYIVPKRSFESPGDAAAFRAFAESHVDSNGS
ncbi:MAG: YcxB family protein [Polyangiales bacterium]